MRRCVCVCVRACVCACVRQQRVRGGTSLPPAHPPARPTLRGADARPPPRALQVGPTDHVICALSGGVDSTVAATLVHKVCVGRAGVSGRVCVCVCSCTFVCVF